ncbi:MAG: hypothetical protein J2P49_09285 [Methylocapsa sp.]|nr:hypothetical protein [Methylocapsa sp.]
MKFKLALAFTAFSVLLTAPAMSQSREQAQAACQDDAFRLCPNDVPDEARIRSCLSQHMGSLSPACRAQFKGGHHRRRRGR